MKIRLVKSANGDSAYGFVDSEYVSGLVNMNAIVDAERKSMNYYILPNGKLVHVYNVFEINS